MFVLSNLVMGKQTGPIDAEEVSQTDRELSRRRQNRSAKKTTQLFLAIR